MTYRRGRNICKFSVCTWAYIAIVGFFFQNTYAMDRGEWKWYAEVASIKRKKRRKKKEITFL